MIFPVSIPLPIAAALVVLAAFAGALLLPLAADRVLRSKHASAIADWDWFYQDYKADLDGTLAERVAETRRCGNAVEKTVDQVLYGRFSDSELAEKRRVEAERWAEEQIALAAGNRLAESQLAKLYEIELVKIPDGDGGDLQAKSVKNAETAAAVMSFPASPLHRAACALLSAALCAVCIVLPIPAMALAWLGAIPLALILICDIRARLIPREACYAMLFSAMLFQLALGGVDALAAALVVAVAIWASFKAISAIIGSSGNAEPMGAGDLRLIPAIAVFSGPAGTLGGIVAMAAVQVLIAVPAMVARFIGAEKGGKLAAMRRLPIPMAPGLAAWWAVGLLIQALS